MLDAYRTEAGRSSGLSFLGRLATYRYMDMHHVIGEALHFSQSFLQSLHDGKSAPVFPNTEN